MVKVRQCQPDTDIASLLGISDLGGWWGRLQPCKEDNKHTTAVLTAPSEEAQKLLEVGHLVDNGRVLAVVPVDSTVAMENERTVLLVGTSKLHAKHKEKGRSLTELSLLKTNRSGNPPIQAITLVELAGGRAGHSAYALMRHAEDIKGLCPVKDTDSDTVLEWADLNHKDMCENAWNGKNMSNHVPNIVALNTNLRQQAKQERRSEEKGDVIQNKPAPS